MLHIELVRRLEQHAIVMLIAPRLSKQGPRRVLQGHVQLIGMSRLILLPFKHCFRKHELVQHATQ